MAYIGQTLPTGRYQAFYRNGIQQIDFHQYRDTWIILIFYPGDFTFVCPTELAEAGNLYPEFKKLGAEVFGVSTDSVYVHKAWHDTSPALKGVDFPLIADPTGSLARDLGVYVEQEGVALRGSFIFDPDGVLKAYEVHDNSIGRSAPELLRKLEAAIRVREGEGEVCPASWRPGEKTLKPGLDLVGKI